MHAVFWQLIYWLSTPVLAVVAILVLSRKVQRNFPLFTSYVSLLLLIDLVRLAAYLGSSFISYFYVYWISDAVASLFAILATGELMLRHLFANFYRVHIYRYLFLFAGVVMVGSSLWTLFSSHPAILFSALIRILHASNVFLAAMLLFFVGLIIFMGRTWGQYEFGIAMGLAVSAAALLLGLAIVAKFGPLRNDARLFLILGEDGAAVVWMVAFLWPQRPVRVPNISVAPEVLTDAKKWQEAARSSFSKKKDPN